jgi:hypothetical protein
VQLLEGPAILTIIPQELPTSSSIASTLSSTLLTTSSQVPSIYFTAPASNKLLTSAHVEMRCNLVMLDPDACNKRVHAPCPLYMLRVVQPALLAAAYNAPFLPQLMLPPPTSRFVARSCSASGRSISALSMNPNKITQIDTNNMRSKLSFERRLLMVRSNSTSSTKLWMICAYHNSQLEWDQMLQPRPNPMGLSPVSAKRSNRPGLSTLPSSIGPTKVGQPGPCLIVLPPQPLTYRVLPPHMLGQVLAVRTCGPQTYTTQNCVTALTLCRPGRQTCRQQTSRRQAQQQQTQS